jgi:hypothetical protein
LTLFLLLVFCRPALCDRGIIPAFLINPNQSTNEVNSNTPVKYFEPNQNALIACDGVEEILYLTTDLSADRPSKVLEVLPLPSEPKVTKGDFKTLRSAVEVLNSKVQSLSYGGTSGGFGGKGFHPSAVEPPAAVIVTREHLGVHEISVVKVLNPAKFVAWTEENLKKLGSTSPSVPEWMKEKIQKYTDSGFNWFAFDVVELQPKLKSIEPIRYRFATKHLFYPLQITKVSGPSAVKLIVMSTRPIKAINPIDGAKIIRSTKAFPLHKEDLEKIDTEMSKLVDKSPSFDRPVIQMLELRNPNGMDYANDLVAGFK